MTEKYDELRQILEDLEAGQALRLDAIQKDLDAIKTRLGGVPPLDAKVVAKLLRLTPAQSRVAVALAEGKTPCAIAEATGCTVGTVRYQLKQIYTKVGISRQVQLVRAVLLGCEGRRAAHRRNEPELDAFAAWEQRPGHVAY